MQEPCVVAREGEAIHRYVAGSLSPQEMEEFEVHLLECDQCQAAVREGIAVSVALEDAAPVEMARGSRATWRIVAVGVAAVATAVAFWPADPLERLGAVEDSPAFQGMPVRADADEPGRLADRGMAAYGEGRWGEAAELLGSAIELDPRPALHFFRGVSLLMAGDAGAAATSLTAALDPRDGPYADEARLYLAKALLRQGRGEEALVHLDAAAPSGEGALTHAERYAAALADSVRAVLGR